MSRFVDDCRARARFAAGCSSGYRMAKETDLAELSDRIAFNLAQAAEDMERLARMEAGKADREAREATIEDFLKRHPDWVRVLTVGHP